MRAGIKTAAAVSAVVGMILFGLLTPLAALERQADDALRQTRQLHYAATGAQQSQTVPPSAYREIAKAVADGNCARCDLADGQMSMMQAVGRTTDLLDRLSDAGVLAAADAADFQQINAAPWTAGGRTGETDDRVQTAVDPTRCFWEVDLLGTRLMVTARVHAVSGKILELLISSSRKRRLDTPERLSQALNVYLRDWDFASEPAESESGMVYADLPESARLTASSGAASAAEVTASRDERVEKILTFSYQENSLRLAWNDASETQN